MGWCLRVVLEGGDWVVIRVLIKVLIRVLIRVLVRVLIGVIGVLR